MKIKIIIALLYLVMILSAAEEENKNLPAVVGGNITLPDLLMERGYLKYGRTHGDAKIIAKVENRSLKIFNDSYRSKLHWNQTSGLFTITDLQRSDSGVYIIESKEGRGFLSSNVTVYDPVETPAVNRTETENHEGNSTIRTNWILILVPIIIAVILLGCCCWFFCRDKIKKKIRKTPGREEVL